MSVISRSDLERLRQSVEPATDFNRSAEKRADLKKKSNDRLQHWPNTLDALRKKKESFLKDREAREELARREIDLQEAEYRKNMRLESIKRANQLLYEQTDKMKMLRSQQLYSDVLQGRSEQVAQKDTIKHANKEKEKAYYEDLLVQIEEAEVREAQKIEAERRRVIEISQTREEQLKEARLRKESERAAEKALGRVIAKNAQVVLVEDAKLQEEQLLKSKQRASEMIEANERQLQLRMIQHQQELDDEKEREREVKLTEDRTYARKALEKRRFEKAQATRQKMIDAAVVSLTSQIQRENARQLRQEQELKDKSDKAFHEKEAKRKEEWEKCVESRTSQVVEKKTKEQKAKEVEQRYSTLLKEQSLEAEREEREKEARARVAAKNLKALQLQEAIDAQRSKVELRLVDREEAEILRELAVQDDKKFEEVVDSEILRYASLGKPVYTLKLAKEAHPPDLLPAILVKKPDTKKIAPA